MRPVLGNRACRALTVAAWLTAFILAAPVVLASEYADATAGWAASVTLALALPLGVALGSWLVAGLDPYVRVRAVPLLSVGVCFPLIATAFGPPWLVALGMWFLAGCCGGSLFGLLTALDRITARAVRSRVRALIWAGLVVAVGCSFVIARLVADRTSPTVTVALYGCAGLVALFALGPRWARAGVGQAVLAASGAPTDMSAGGRFCAADCLARSGPSCSSACERLRD